MPQGRTCLHNSLEAGLTGLLSTGASHQGPAWAEPATPTLSNPFYLQQDGCDLHPNMHKCTLVPCNVGATHEFCVQGTLQPLIHMSAQNYATHYYTLQQIHVPSCNAQRFFIEYKHTTWQARWPTIRIFC